MRPFPPYAVTFAFRNLTAYGWSETYWWNGTSPPDAASSDTLALANARMGCATTSVTLTHIRASQGPPRQVSIFVPNSGSGITGSLPAPTTPSEVALEIRFQPDFAGPFGKVYMRGIPLANIASDEFVPTTDFTTAFNNYSSVLTNSTWAIYSTLGSPATRYNAFGFSPTLPRGFNFQSLTFTPTVGQQIRVHGTSVPGYAGVKTIVGILAGPPQTISVGGAAPAAADSSPGAFITAVTYTHPLIKNVQIEGLSRRGAGRPFGVSRGRRPTLYSLRR